MMVNTTTKHELLSFMDSYYRYNQIMIHCSDQKNTFFISERRIYCYKVMPFRLQNTNATYQRLVNKMFVDYLGSSMEIYIDDILVKVLQVELHVDHLHKSFKVLDKYQMKLSCEKCNFGVSGKIIDDPCKMLSLRHVKQVQGLTGKMATLSLFIFRLLEKFVGFFRILKKKDAFVWTSKCEEVI